MLITLTILLALTIIGIAFLKQPKFGRLPTGTQVERIKQSPNYKNGAFQNQSITPDLTDGATYFSVSKEFFFGDKKHRTPTDTIPATKTNLLTLDKTLDVLVWFGHSSYFMQVDGKRILVDPVFCGAASPVSFSTKAFKGTDRYTPADMPDIDYLFISHDHWDHLDYQTLQLLKPKIKKVICGLGTGAHFAHWGFDKNAIIEKDWNEEIILADGFAAYTTPARHFSGRGLKRNQSLWMSYVLQTPTLKIFIGGDSGYDTHFAETGKKFGPFDIAILENGQYDKSWKHIHMMPAEVLQAANDLQAKRILPAHSAKFSLAIHAWDAPLNTITELNKVANIPLITPMIGEQVNLKDPTQSFTQWWTTIN